MTDVEIKVRLNGPYLVKGPFTLVDGEGNPFDVEEGKTIALCRCGGSTKKPFCDGTHSRIGFDAASRAVAEAEAAQVSEDLTGATGADVDSDPEAPVS